MFIRDFGQFFKYFEKMKQINILHARLQYFHHTPYGEVKIVHLLEEML